jgi:hypothetical protein
MRNLSRNRYVMPILIAVIVSVGACPASSVVASETTPCLEEIEKYCNDVKPGEGILKCLQDHDKDLSTVCRQKVEANSRNLLTDRKLCARDIETFCKGVVPGGGRILRCLGGHRDELSPDCREVITARNMAPSGASNPAEPSAQKPADTATGSPK